MKIRCLACLFILFHLPLLGNFQPGSFSPGPLAAFNPGDGLYVAEEVRERVQNMPCLVDVKYDRVVEAYITGYVVRHRERTAAILGRVAQYFPLFEEMLREYDMPEELKYLAVVESALNPKAVSRVGATGLWQFMEETGRHYGLKIDHLVDERSDPVKSTEAAIRYLRKQYDRFGSWALALAAYNSGPGRVSRAIRRSGSRNFWRLRRYLPRETRNYVPAYIAATYLCLHHEKHQLHPQSPSLDFLLTDRIKVHEYLPFQRLAQITGLPLNDIAALNPAYKQDYIPADPSGHYLELPRRVMPAVVDYLRMKREGQIPNGLQWADVRTFAPQGYDPDQYYFSSIYVVQPNDTLDKLAKLFRCSVHTLKAWNQFDSPDLQPGQEIRLYYPREVLHFNQRIQGSMSILLPRRMDIPLTPPDYNPYALDPTQKENRRYRIYESYGGESLRHLSTMHGFSLQELVEHNSRYEPDEILREGRRIKIPKS